MRRSRLWAGLAALTMTVTVTSCDNLFIFIDPNGGGGYNTEWIKDTNNQLFFALYNYYGQDGQHFTNRWLGMLDALNEYGIEVTGHEYEKDARNFKIDYTNSKLPEDADPLCVFFKYVNKHMLHIFFVSLCSQREHGS